MPGPRFSSARACAITAILALAWPSSAHAFCRAVTASPPAGFDPADAGCFGFGAGGGPTGGLFPLFWRNQCVSYSFQTTPSKKISLADAKRVAAAAFGAWSGASCPGGHPSILAYNFPEVDCNDVPSTEHSNIIIFRDGSWPYDDAANAIGYTTLTVDLTTGEILGADTEINSAQYNIVPDPPAPAGSYDLATILTHEAGHFLGLAHSAENTAVMYATYHAATTLQPDDAAAICSIYAADGTRNTADGPNVSESCNPAPIAGFFPNSCGSFDGGTANLSAIGSGAGVNSGVLASPCPDESGCSIAAASPNRGVPWGIGVMTGGLLAAGTLAGLARRARRRRAMSLVLGLAFLGASATAAREAGASVSVAAVFDDMVKDATAAAVVTPTEQRASWEGNRIVTLTHLHVDRIVAGQLPEDVWVRTLGGSVGHIGQIVEGQATFAVGSASLLFVRPHVDPVTKTPSDTFAVVDSAQGQFPLVAGEGHAIRLGRAGNLGELLDTRKKAGTRFARDVLVGRALDDAVREIAATWARLH
jgi:hypothetical protein